MKAVSSRIFKGTVRHTRTSPVEHDFDYHVYGYVFDIDELDALDADNLLFGHNRIRPVSVHDADYLEPGDAPLRHKLTRLLTERGHADIAREVADANGRVLLVTSARFFNYVFNPVSFWFCFDARETIRCIVAEVNNTFGDKHAYVLPVDEGGDSNSSFPVLARHAKEFHVSPFFDISGEYRFVFGDVRCEVDVTVELQREGQPVFSATIQSTEELAPLTTRTLWRTILHAPATAGLTYPRILWQAARLAAGRRLPAHTRPKPRSPHTVRYNAKLTVPERIATAVGFVKTAAATIFSPSRLVGGLARRVMLALLEGVQHGRIAVTLPDGSRRVFAGPHPGRNVALTIKDERFFPLLATSGDIGFGDAYMEGWWHAGGPRESGDEHGDEYGDEHGADPVADHVGGLQEPHALPDLIAFLSENERALSLSARMGVPAPLVRFFARMRALAGDRNDQAGAERNIHAHYDLSNDLFETFLDDTWAYSSALYENPDNEAEDLHAAQLRKFDRILELSHICPGEHLLEIGCGWGGFAIHAARTRGCRVTGVTISREQYDMARKRVYEAGLADRVDIRYQDYRTLPDENPTACDSFDAIVSIEMIEAVGHEFHPEYFRTIDALLAPHGRAVLQAITIYDQRYDLYRREGDWIIKRIFPGGLLPSLTRIAQVVSQHTHMVIRHVDDIAPHYVRTLAQWRKRFLAKRARVLALGFDERFIRAWEYYFAYCQAGFETGVIGDLHMVLQRPGHLAASRCAWTAPATPEPNDPETSP